MHGECQSDIKIQVPQKTANLAEEKYRKPVFRDKILPEMAW
jgi:hypothetical protein